MPKMSKRIVANVNEKERNIALIGMLLTFLIAIVTWSFIKDAQTPESELASILPPDGRPVLILQNKVGDDVVPHIHQTYCQILPYKRRIQDDQVFCYVEVITDWSVE